MALLETKYTCKILLCVLVAGGSVTDALQPIIPLNFTQIARNAGLTCEEKRLTTEDGYILDIFHLPGNRSRPTLLLSGAFGTADDYIIRENTSLPYTLARAGYDVWVGNVRGCRYGLNHVTLDPNRDIAFWNFSFNEYAVYDTAAMVDFVLNSTQQRQLSAIGWSLGTTSFYILGSERPEYIDKVKVVLSFAPIAYLHHSPAFAAMTVPGTILNAALIMAGTTEIFGENSTETILLRNICSTPEVAYNVCLQIAFLIYGFDPDEIEEDFAPVMFAHYPSSISRKTLSHLLQVLRSKRFAKYDYGAKENRRIYGTLKPTEYDLSKNEMNIVFISGKNDQTSTLPDVELLKAKLPNVVEHIILEPDKFNHVDFVQGKNTHKVLYETTVLDLLSNYN